MGWGMALRDEHRSFVVSDSYSRRGVWMWKSVKLWIFWKCFLGWNIWAWLKLWSREMLRQLWMWLTGLVSLISPLAILYALVEIFCSSYLMFRFLLSGVMLIVWLKLLIGPLVWMRACLVGLIHLHLWMDCSIICTCYWLLRNFLFKKNSSNKNTIRSDLFGYLILKCYISTNSYVRWFMKQI